MNWQLTHILGSKFEEYKGIVALPENLAGHRKEFLSPGSSIILGPDLSKHKSVIDTQVIWHLPTTRHRPSNFLTPYLVIACRRRFGGLHSKYKNGHATVWLNNKSVDRVNLRQKAEGHSDWFHRAPLPVDLPQLEPYQNCQTIYAWPITQEHLVNRAYQEVSVEIGPNVNWDIDYIGIAYRARDHHRIFISYCHEDSRIALNLHDRLKISGINAWIDTAEIRAGESLIDRIAAAIEAVDYVVVLLSKHSIKSDWVQLELKIAITHEIGGRNLTIIPVVLDDCNIPSFLAFKRYINLKSKNNRYLRFMKEISLILDENNNVINS